MILRSVSQLGEKAVVFSWRLDPLRLLGNRLAMQCGRDSFRVITGDTSAAERSRIVSLFQTSRYRRSRPDAEVESPGRDLPKPNRTGGLSGGTSLACGTVPDGMRESCRQVAFPAPRASLSPKSSRMPHAE